MTCQCDTLADMNGLSIAVFCHKKTPNLCIIDYFHNLLDAFDNPIDRFGNPMSRMSWVQFPQGAFFYTTRYIGRNDSKRAFFSSRRCFFVSRSERDLPLYEYFDDSLRPYVLWF